MTMNNVKMNETIQPVGKWIGKNIGKISLTIGGVLFWMWDRKRQYNKGKAEGEKEGYLQASKEWEKKFQKTEKAYKTVAKNIRELNRLMQEYEKLRISSPSEVERQHCNKRIEEIQNKIDYLTRP